MARCSKAFSSQKVFNSSLVSSRLQPYTMLSSNLRMGSSKYSLSSIFLSLIYLSRKPRFGEEDIVLIGSVRVPYISSTK